jgi:hypothetical protein
MIFLAASAEGSALIHRHGAVSLTKKLTKTTSANGAALNTDVKWPTALDVG